MKFVVPVSLCLVVVTINALNCPCHNNRGNCPEPKCKRGVGVVMDPCGCCKVCSQQKWQKCGGPWNALGKCDPTKKLDCVAKPLCGPPMRTPFPGKPPGICIPPRHLRILKKYCGPQRDLLCSTNPFAHNEE
ncbi:venom protein 302-like [Styela clava]